MDDATTPAMQRMKKIEELDSFDNLEVRPSGRDNATVSSAPRETSRSGPLD
jgi:hypothetical protein